MAGQAQQPRDALGRPAVTAAQLEQMTPAERERVLADRVVWDLSTVPAGLLGRLMIDDAVILQRSADLDRQRESAEQARREGLRAS